MGGGGLSEGVGGLLGHGDPSAENISQRRCHLLPQGIALHPQGDPPPHPERFHFPSGD